MRADILVSKTNPSGSHGRNPFPPGVRPQPRRIPDSTCFMARKKQDCTLPVLRRPARLRGRPLTDTQLAEILRRIALNYRTAESQPFYPLRDAARQLDVPMSALRRAYARLSKQGRLT